MANGTQGVVRARIRSTRGAKEPRTWHLAPSDFAFLWDECQRCFYRKVVRHRPRPGGPFPKVFGVIDRSMKRALVGRQLEELVPGAPAGVLIDPDRWLVSAPLELPHTASRVVLRGRSDLLHVREDGALGVVDLKTARPRDPHVALYGRQLHAYGLALEQPASGPPRTVGTLGLLAFEPDGFELGGTSPALVGELTWTEIPRQDKEMARFLAEVVTVLERPQAPDPGNACQWCAAETSSSSQAVAQ